MITLENLQRELERANNSVLEPCQQENLRYALLTIRPRTHQEYAFVVWCGGRLTSVSELIDEYASRKNGNVPNISVCPNLALENWCVPNTYGIPVFWEQFQVFMKEYKYAISCTKADIVLLEVAYNDSHADKFRIHLEAIGLTRDEAEYLTKVIRDFYPGSSQYARCSSIVERAATEQKELATNCALD